MEKIKPKFQFAGLIVLSLLFSSYVCPSNLTAKKGNCMPSSSLVLYYRPSCPYCHKVLDFMKKENITLETKDTSDPKIREELIQVGGKPQVPCLVHDGKALYESNDIINWLAENCTPKGHSDPHA